MRNFSVAMQLNDDQEQRRVTQYPSEGYAVADPAAYNTASQHQLAVAEEFVLYEDTTISPVDWRLLTVESLDFPVNLRLELRDDLGVAQGSLELRLVPGLPLMLGTRFVPSVSNPPSLAIYVVTVVETSGVTSPSIRWTHLK